MNYLMEAAASYLFTMTVITVIVFLAEYGLILMIPFILIGDAIAWIYKKVKSFIKLPRYRKRERITEYNSQILEMLGIR
tara:strand:- start:153 stop:389 length:237 start_codon:yes stop_codon:yes gene_type:complete